jgi:predicted permease
MRLRSLAGIPRALRYAIRSLRKSPGFAALAIASLALGIGANTALFALVDGLLVRPLPVRDPDRLATVARVNPATGKYLPLDRDAFEALAGLAPIVDGAGAFAPVYNPDLRVDSLPEPNRQVVRTTATFLTVLGARASVGALDSETPAAVISERFWKERFGGRADVLGRSLTVDERAHPIVGVAAAPFLGVSLDASVDVWLVASPPAVTASTAMVRVRAGVSLAQLGEAAGAVFRRLDEDRGGLDPSQQAPTTLVLSARRGFSNLRDHYQGPLRALMMLVALVLLITCANIGNLLVVRTAANARELTVRAALGARRVQLIAQLLVESAVLATVGGAAAWFVARWCVSLLLSTLPLAEIPQQLQFTTDARLVAYMLTITLVCAVLFSLAPAWRATRFALTGTLKTSHGIGPASGSRRLAWWLVAGQTALSVVLLTSAGLFYQTVRNVTHLELGFDSRNLVQIEMRRDAIRLANVDRRSRQFSAAGVRRVFGALSERIKAIPGVQRVSASFNPLLASYYVGLPQPEGPSGHMVGPEYFELLGIPVVRGRTFSADDVWREGGVAVVSESYERAAFPGGSALGQRINVGAQSLDVVGVVADAKLDNVRWNGVERTFRLGLREARPMEAFLVRTSVDPRSIVRPLQQAVNEVVPGVLVSVRTVDEVIQRSIARERLVAAASGLFAILGVALAGVGLFGIASYSISRRTSELGLRMALGATRWHVLRESLRDTTIVFGVGVIVGTLAAVAATRLAGSLIAGLLFGLEPTDWPTIAVVVVVMIAAALAACLVPALRATRIDPLEALRYE